MNIDAALDAIGTANDFIPYATAMDDECYDGQHNFQVVTEYAHRCSLRLTRFFGFDGDFRQKMINFEKYVITTGWNHGYIDFYSKSASRTGNMEYIMINYYDKAPHRSLEFIPTPGGYHNSKLIMGIAWAEKSSTTISNFDYSQKDTRGGFYNNRSFVNVREVFDNATREHRYLISVAIWGNYFEN